MTAGLMRLMEGGATQGGRFLSSRLFLRFALLHFVCCVSRAGFLECATKNPVKKGLSKMLVTDWPLLMGASRSSQEESSLRHDHFYFISEQVQCECLDNPGECYLVRSC